MEICIDTANIDEVKKGVEWGVVDGVTTNPSLVAKENKPFRKIVKEISKIVKGDVSAEVVGTDYMSIVKEATSLSKIGKNVVVKVPMTPDALRAVQDLSPKIRFNVTLVFSSNQALLAAKSGAYIVSAFVGRMDDVGQDGEQLVDEIREIYDNYRYKTKILFASVRSPAHVKQAALIGADIVTCPFGVIEQLYKHPQTDDGLRKFLDDWSELNQKIT